MKALISSGLVAAALLLGGCGEKPQVAATKQSDAKPWEGAQSEMDSGWKVGDQASWGEHMHSRTQRGQNEYNRTSATP